MEQKHLPEEIAKVVIELAKISRDVNYGNAGVKMTNVGGVATSAIFANTQKIRFHGESNNDVFAKFVDVVNNLPKDGKSEAGFKVSAENGAVREVEIETTKSIYFQRKPEEKTKTKAL